MAFDSQQEVPVGRPVLAVSLAFVGGVALGAWLPQEPAAWGWAAAVALALWAALLAAGGSPRGSRVGLAVFVVVGIFRIQGDLAPLYAGGDPLAEGDAVAGGRVARPAELRDGETVLHLENVRLRRRRGDGPSGTAAPGHRRRARGAG